MPNTKRAVLELGINVPIYRTEAGPNGVVILYAYGGTRYEWDPGHAQDPERTVATGDSKGPDRGLPEDPPVTKHDDLTAIPHVGPATARDLHRAGLHTFQDLHHATDQQLLSLNNVTTLTLQYIRNWLSSNHNLRERTKP
jgi:predicted flap endonuclease-1-like 5' DNA nuclease